MVTKAGSEEKKSLYGILSFSSLLFLPLFPLSSLTSPFQPLFPFRLCPFAVPGSPPPNPDRGLGESSPRVQLTNSLVH